MKVRELIKKIDKSDKFKEDADLHKMAEREFSIFGFYGRDESERLVAYYLANWYCTDTWVGLRVYFLDDKPVAISYQGARKSDEEFEWLSKKAYKQVQKYILSLKEDEEDEDSFVLCDLNKDLGDAYNIQYSSQLFDYHKNIPLYEGKNVKIIAKSSSHEFNEKGEYGPSLVHVQFEDRSTDWMEVNKLDFPYNIK